MNNLKIKYINDEQKIAILIYDVYANKGLKFLVLLSTLALITSIFYKDAIGIGSVIIFFGLLDVYSKCRRTEIAFFNHTPKITIISRRLLKRVITIPLDLSQPLPVLVAEMGEYQYSSGQLKGTQLTVKANNHEQTLLLTDFATLLNPAECQSIARETNTFIQTQLRRYSEM